MTDSPKPKQAKQAKGASGLGSIQADAAYPYEEFQRLTGQGRTAMRSFRMQGLRVIRAGNRRYILGRDWMAFLDSLASGGQAESGNVAALTEDAWH